MKAEKLLKSLSKADRERLLREEAARENKILSDSKGYAASYKGDNTRGSVALKFALAQIGDIYVWAAAGPTRWDCSGLTMRAFQKAGVSLPHSSRVQVKYGKSIAYSNLKPGDLVTIQLIIKTENDLEFVHLKDLRASCFEPVNVISKYKWENLSYYMSTKDVATHFFFDSIKRGTYIIDYEVRVTNSGSFNNGIATLQSMYAPEFTGYSTSTKLKIKD